MKLGRDPRKWLQKKAKRGVANYPIGTVAFYGPDDLTSFQSGRYRDVGTKALLNRPTCDGGSLKPRT